MIQRSCQPVELKRQLPLPGITPLLRRCPRHCALPPFWSTCRDPSLRPRRTAREPQGAPHARASGSRPPGALPASHRGFWSLTNALPCSIVLQRGGGYRGWERACKAWHPNTPRPRTPFPGRSMKAACLILAALAVGASAAGTPTVAHGGGSGGRWRRPVACPDQQCTVPAGGTCGSSDCVQCFPTFSSGDGTDTPDPKQCKTPWRATADEWHHMMWRWLAGFTPICRTMR